MSAKWQVVRRVGFAVFAVYLVLSITFGFVALTPDPNIAPELWEAVRHQGASAEEVQQVNQAYLEATNRDIPVFDRYVQWLADITTLDWGTSFNQNVPVTGLIGQALPYTLAYIFPGVAFALVGGIAIGVYSATHHHTLLDRLATGFGYLGFSVPNFWIAEVFILVLVTELGWFDQSAADGTWAILSQLVLPAAILGTSLLAGQVRYARAESLEYINAEFVKLVRAKGASGWRVARHILRNAALPLLSLFFTDLLAVLVVNIYVIETVFGIPGLGTLSLEAIQNRDMPVILGTTMVIVLFGIVGNLVQDLAYVVLDPRVGDTQ